MGLGRYLVRRVLTFIPTLLGVLLITYLIAYAIPADPVRAWVGQKLMNPEALETIRKKYRFDAPWYEQFVFLVGELLTGRLEDPVRVRNVFDDIFVRFPITVQLAVISFVFHIVVGIPLGVVAALKKDSAIDFFVRIFALVGGSLPSFVLYYFLILALFVYFPGTRLAGIPMPSPACRLWLSSLPESVPVAGHLVSAVGSVPMFGAAMCGEWGVVVESLKRMYLPGLAIALLNGGFIARIVRNSLLDVLGSEFILYARARGLRRTTIWRHALKNSLIPVVTVLGLIFSWLLSGVVIAEVVFNIPGLGRYMYDAITRLNFPVIIASTFLVALVYIVVNLIIDVAYAVIDPRIRY